jgi:dienelactone hydrolase
MIHFDGFDGLKESIYRGSAEEFRRRGISLLVVDHPGVGEALRLRNMTTGSDTEVPAKACVDYLETRPEVDKNRIGIVALSLGGYYAPRAAAFEKRLKCCVAWGAIWDWGELVQKRIVGKGGELSVPDWVDQLLWVLGKSSVEEAVAFAKQFTLEGVADKITCPLLVIHGENDRQIPVAHAEKTISAAVNSPETKLKLFRLSEGGAEHCQADNSAMAIDYIADWVAEVLGGEVKGI